MLGTARSCKVIEDKRFTGTHFQGKMIDVNFDVVPFSTSIDSSLVSLNIITDS